jgi:hypothetical protein
MTFDMKTEENEFWKKHQWMANIIADLVHSNADFELLHKLAKGFRDRDLIPASSVKGLVDALKWYADIGNYKSPKDHTMAAVAIETLVAFQEVNG